MIVMDCHGIFVLGIPWGWVRFVGRRSRWPRRSSGGSRTFVVEAVGRGLAGGVPRGVQEVQGVGGSW